MIIEFEGDIYRTVINDPIKEGDLYYDCVVNEVKLCNTNNHFDPWTLKMEKILNNNDQTN